MQFVNEWVNQERFRLCTLVFTVGSAQLRSGAQIFSANVGGVVTDTVPGR